MHLEIYVSKILDHRPLFVALGSDFKCSCKIHLNTKCPLILADQLTLFQPEGAIQCPCHIANPPGF